MTKPKKNTEFNPSQSTHQKLLITGSTGYLGQHLMGLLRDNGPYSVSLITRDKYKARLLYPDQTIELFEYADIRSDLNRSDCFDCLIHLGFTHDKQNYQKVAESLETTSILFNKAKQWRIPSIINITSLNVYGLNKPPFWKEEDTLYPELPFGMAKYATELLLQGITHSDDRINGTSLRLTALSGGNILINKIELINKLIEQVLNQHQIVIYGGQQRFERLDVRDAAMAIIQLMQVPSSKWKPVYNIGVGKNYSLLEIAELVIQISKELDIHYPYNLKVEQKEDPTAFGVDSTLFIDEVNWKPVYDIKEIIRSVYAKKLEQL
jgi:nucleoside-diphosphate-sugar epimerase